MFKLPPWPGFDGLHPLVVHFPIALLIVAPLFMLGAIVFWRQRLPMLSAAAVLLAIGVVALFITFASGSAAAELADRSDAVNPVLAHHEELAETTRIVFTILAAILIVALVAMAWLKERVKRPAWSAVLGVYVAVYAVCLLLLVNTAHQGGRLVHELGVRSMVSADGAS